MNGNASSSHACYSPSPDVRHVRLGGRSAFFSERDQRLYELNATAELIWTSLQEGEHPRAARAALMALGADEREARTYVEGQLGAWLKAGHWTSRDAVPGRAGRLRLAVDGLRVEIGCRDARALARLKSLLSSFPSFAGAPAVRLRIEAGEDGYALSEDGVDQGRAPADGLAAWVKAVITRRLVDQPRPGFYAHGALLTSSGRTLFLSGAPGAGKTTLALALAEAGWALLADDVVRVHASGLFAGVPFAPAVKSGAWPLLAERLPELAAWPVEQRPDGQQLRYAAGLARRAKPKAPNLFLVLARDGAGSPRVTPIDQLEALTTLLSEAYAADHRLAADLLARLADRFQTLLCARLSYGALDGAVAEIGRLAETLDHAA